MSLTDAQVKAEKPSTTRRRVSDGGGLLLEVDPGGGKYWIWRHRYPPSKKGKQQDYRIGPYPLVSLKKARYIRDDLRRQMLAEGIDPCAAKRQARLKRVALQQALTTFESIAPGCPTHLSREIHVMPSCDV
jgi:hypothetical protein